MVELFMLDDVGQAYDLASREEGRTATTLGRHTNDFMTSFYSRTPSGFLVEYGWGGRSIDPDTWKPAEMRSRAALEGQRQPVQVIEGNYTLAPGTCPWWDATRQAGG